MSGGLALAVTAGGALSTVFVVLPSFAGAWLVAAGVWFVAPGVAASWSLYRGRWSWGALLMAPAWGYLSSSLVLLGLWLLGLRSAMAIVLAPVIASPLGWAVGRLGRGRLRMPAFTRKDALAFSCVLLIVPLVVARPYSRVGVQTPEGKAYRAYFTADFVWAMAVVSEVSKGEQIPRNPYLTGENLHYYWLAHLFPAVEHRALRQVPLDSLLLVNAVLGAILFMSFLYYFTRHFTDRPSVAAAACCGVVLFTSFEGAFELLSLWRAGAPAALVRDVNIDAVTRWFLSSMPVDGLQRLLLYQPQHQLGYSLGFSALAVLVESEALADFGVLMLAGVLLGGAFLVSTFAAIMLGVAAAIFQAARIVSARAWSALWTSVLGATPPVACAAALALGLGYVEEGRSLVTLGVNPLAVTRWASALVLSVGPMVPAVAYAAWLAVRNAALHRYGVPLAVVATSLAFYFLVDVVDHQHVYVSWRAGHLIFIACAPLCAYVMQELLRGSLRARTLALTVAGLLCLLAAPTTVIDLYNTQDIHNRGRAPGFAWTVVLSQDELDALTWVRRATPADAKVQVEPTVRDPETWAYIPAFGERRMAAGIPISMVPLEPYRSASRRIRRVYASKTTDALSYDARKQGIDYLIVAPPERRAYPELEPLLEADPTDFTPVFHNASVRIYHVNRRRS